MKKKKNEPTRPIEPQEELTTLMHSTFTIPEENELEFRVWAAVRAMEQTGWPLERILKAFELPADVFEKYKNTQPSRNG